MAITTWASFASMCLIPRLEAFQSEHPDIDLRIDASDNRVDPATADVDIALRYARAGSVPENAIRPFGEQLTPVASPWLLKSGQAPKKGADLAHFALIEASDGHRNQSLEFLAWRRWLDHYGFRQLEPKRWLYFNYAHQIAQAALAGEPQGASPLSPYTGQTAPFSFRMASSGTSWACGSKSGRKPWVKPRPTVKGLGCSVASVRS